MFLGIIPIIGAALGAVSTVSGMIRGASAASSSKAYMKKQQQLEEERLGLLIKQRQNAERNALFDFARDNRQAQILRDQQLFENKLKRSADAMTQAQQQLALNQAEFGATQQRLMADTQAYGEAMSNFNQLFDLAGQTSKTNDELAQQSEVGKAQASAQGQSNSVTAQNRQDALALAMDTNSQQMNELFGSIQAQTNQNTERALAMNGLQQKLSLSGVDAQRELNNLSGLYNNSVSDINAQNIRRQFQLNRQARRYDLASTMQNLLLTGTSEALASQQRQASMSQQAASISSPGILDFVTPLANVGLAIYQNQPLRQPVLPTRQTQPSAPVTWNNNNNWALDAARASADMSYSVYSGAARVTPTGGFTSPNLSGTGSVSSPGLFNL